MIQSLPKKISFKMKATYAFCLMRYLTQCAARTRGELLGILGGGVPPGSPNPDPISDQKCHFPHPFSGLKEVTKRIIHIFISH